MTHGNSGNVTNGTLGLADSEFWSNPERTRAAVLKQLSGDDALGITLDAPRAAPDDEDETLPVAIIFLRTFAEDVQFDVEQQLLLSVVREADNVLWCGFPLATGKTPEGGDETGGPPPERPLVGKIGQLFVEDARERLGLPGGRGRLHMTAHLRDRNSNTVVTELGPTAADYQDAEVEAYLAARDAASLPPPPGPVWPPLPQISGAITRALDGGPDPFPNYRQRDASPPLPDTFGINVSLERVVEVGPGRRCVLRGAFRLPAGKYERVQFDPQTGRLMDVGVPGATAVCKIHLVGTSTRAAGPFVVPLRVPSYDPVPAEGGPVTGFFNIDLFQVPSMPQREDTYFFTAFSRDIVAGPHPVGLVRSAAE